jgi:lysozyme
MKLDENGYKLITGFEGLKLKPYLCSARIPTIGYGNTYYSNGKHVTFLDEAITQVQAFEMFKEIADRFALAVNRQLKKTVTQNQFNSLVSFAYNVGTGAFISSTLLKKVNSNPNDPSIKTEFLKWNKAGGKIVNGLTIRRNQEQINYFLK